MNQPELQPDSSLNNQTILMVIVYISRKIAST